MKINISILLFLAFTTQLSFSQVFSTTAKIKNVVSADTVYWFADWSQAIVKAEANDNDATIEWYAFDSEKLEYSDLIKTTKGKQDSQNFSSAGGYKCQITSKGNTSSVCFWVDVPTIANLEMSIDSVYCDGMDVSSQVVAEPTKVYNSALAEWTQMAQKIIYNWYVADTLQLTTNVAHVTLESPMDDTTIKVVAINQMDNSIAVIDSVSSYGVRALYSYSERERDVDNEITTSGSYSAPAEIEFKNNSKGNVTVCEWVMGDVSRLYEKNPVYSFQTSGTYKVVLVVTDEITGCSSVDSTLELTITDAFLGFPQIFTPNGDGVNDEFRPAYKSLKSYDIKIYNRWGRRIYHSTDPSTGWNGKEGNADAAEGVYMYVAEAIGFDKGVTIKKHGSVTLVR